MNAFASITINVPFSWRPITASDQGDWPFRIDPDVSPSLGCHHFGPNVYRFYFEPGDGGAACYIGEAEEFGDRLRDYIQAVRGARSKTSESWAAFNEELKSDPKERRQMVSDPTYRVAGRILSAEAAGSKVRLELLEFSDFYFDRILISADQIGDVFMRRAIENLAILHSRSPKIEILNRGTDVCWKFFTRLLAENAKVLNATQK